MIRGSAGKQDDWVPTKPGGRFEAIYRLHGPDKPPFDRTWVLGDVEKL